MQRHDQANDPSGLGEAPWLRKKALALGLLAMRHGMADVQDMLDLVEHWQDGEPLTFRDRIMQALKLTEIKYKVLESFYEEYKLQGIGLDDELSVTLTNLTQTRDLQKLKAQPLVEELAEMSKNQEEPERTPTLKLHPEFEVRLTFKTNGVVGTGGQGIVYRAADNGLLRDIAIKSLKNDFSDPSKTRFHREAKYLASLQHPGVVPIYFFGDDSGENPFIAMRLLPKRTFHTVIREYHQAVKDGLISKSDQSLKFRDLIRNLVQICQTLDYAHSVDIIHRDLKPANIIIGEHGEAFVIDWGLARQLNSNNDATADDGQKPGRQRKSSSLSDSIGTPEYMAPEQARGEGEKQGKCTDIFGLGAIFYVILTNTSPFLGDSGNSALQRALEYDLKKPSEVAKGVDPALEKICLKAMKEEPAGRYASVKNLIDDLNRWLADEPVSVHPDSMIRKFNRWSSRNRTLVASVFSILTMTIISLAILAIVFYSQQAKTAKALDLAIENKKQADQNFNDALILASDSFETLSLLLPNTPGIGTQRFERARNLARKFEHLRENNPDDEKLLNSVVFTLHETANAARFLGMAEAESYYLQAIKLTDSLLEPTGETINASTIRPRLLLDYAEQLRMTNRHVQAETTLEHVKKFLDNRLVQTRQSEPMFLLRLQYLDALAGLLVETGDTSRASLTVDSALELTKQPIAKKLQAVEVFSKLIAAIQLRGIEISEMKGQVAEARKAYENMIGMMDPSPVDPDLKMLRGKVLNRYLNLISTDKSIFMSQVLRLNEAARIFTELKNAYAPTLIYDGEHSLSILNSTSFQMLRNDFASAETILKNEIALISESLLAQDQAVKRSIRGRLYGRLTVVLAARQQRAEANEARKQSLRDYDQVLQKLPMRQFDIQELKQSKDP